MSLLGVVLYLLGHQALIFPAAVAGAISSALSMAGGEFLSDSDSGLGASAVMGLATGLGALLPALPFAFTRGPAALAVMITTCVLIGALVGAMRARNCERHTFWQEMAGTLAVLALVFGVVTACTLLLPGVPG